MDDVRLIAYNPLWSAMYAAEIARVCAVLPARLLIDTAHFGSTAIPGMLAKSVIDMLMLVRSLDEARTHAVAPLETLGYLRHRTDREAYTDAKSDYVKGVLAKT